MKTRGANIIYGHSVNARKIEQQLNYQQQSMQTKHVKIQSHTHVKDVSARSWPCHRCDKELRDRLHELVAHSPIFQFT